MNPREQLDTLESRMASENDRSVEEYRSYYVDNVVAIDALRSVLDIHEPYSDTGDCAGCGLSSGEEPFPWPCDTVKAITTALEAS